MINADLRHNRLISLNEYERLIASDSSAHENFFYKHSRGKHSKHYTSRVSVYRKSFRVPKNRLRLIVRAHWAR